MTDLSKWEPLVDVLHRLLSRGRNEGQVKANLCNAIADRAIELRVCCANGEELASGDIDAPKRLNPADFDWTQSRPRKPWQRRATIADRYEQRDVMIDVILIELRRDSVTKALLATNKTAEAGALDALAGERSANLVSHPGEKRVAGVEKPPAGALAAQTDRGQVVTGTEDWSDGSDPGSVDGWLNLWQLANTLAPNTCHVASWWVSNPPRVCPQLSQTVAAVRCIAARKFRAVLS